MSRPDISDLFAKINREKFGGDVPDIPVIYNERLRTTAGRCWSRSEPIWQNFATREVSATPMREWAWLEQTNLIPTKIEKARDSILAFAIKTPYSHSRKHH